MTVVVRPDLSQRVALSKSAIATFEWCPTQAWFEIHHRKPIILDEGLVFGSAVDAITETLIKSHQQGLPRETAMRLALDAAAYITKRDGIELDSTELTRAANGFWDHVMPKHDWSQARLQADLTADIAGLGICNGHPDILMPGKVWDVKAKTYAPKPPFVELGFYAILAEETEGEPITEVGYIVWRRLKSPYWETVSTPMTGALRALTFNRAQQFARLREIDAERNAGRDVPRNDVFAGGPKYADKCRTCAYAPRNGGECDIAWEETK